MNASCPLADVLVTAQHEQVERQLTSDELSRYRGVRPLPVLHLVAIPAPAVERPQLMAVYETLLGWIARIRHCDASARFPM